ncbi:hypothetical protein DRI50_01400 [candidate division KSB1 bacterium]|nr:MAG: hypothetical protein DRI50_01400 [candidate division KSB1 bacterium]
MKHCLILLLLTSQLVFAGTIYYVDNTVNHSGNGTFDQPFTSVAGAFNQLQAGDTLFIRGNSTAPARVYSEELSLGSSAASGTEGQPIVVASYPGELVKIVLKKSFSIYAAYWVFENLIFDMDGKTYDLIKLKGDHDTFRHCEFTNGQRDGFDINGASNTLIENCTIHNFVRSDQYDAHGIILNGGVDNVIRNNTIYDCKGDCIQLYKEDQNYGTLIEGNDLYTTLGSNSENAIDVKAARNLTIRNNKMHGFHRAEDSDGVALKINKDTDNTLVYGNDIFESNGGIRVSGGDVDSIRIERNVIHDLHVDEGDSSKYGYGIQMDGVNAIQLINNTFANIPGPLFWIASRGADGFTMENNLFFHANKFKGSTSDLKDVVLIDYNGWFQCAETINGQHDVTGDDPKFVDPAAYDYHLKENSPAIDQGDPSFGTDFPGERIDLGAFEFKQATGFNTNHPSVPNQSDLLRAYPNPFNPQTTLEFKLDKPSNVRLEIFDVLGQKIDTLLNRLQVPGHYRVHWQAGHLPAGIYFARLQVNRKTCVRSIVLLK